MSKFDAEARPSFTDAKLTPRARRMAEWLCDLTNLTLDVRSRRASGELLLRELPDHWVGDELYAESVRIRRTIGPKRPRTEWLSQMGWLVGEREQLPERPEQTMSEAARFRAQQTLRAMLTRLAAAQTQSGTTSRSRTGTSVGKSRER